MSVTWGALSGRLITQAKKMRIPISGAFELTPRCNLQCKMCYICRPSKDINTLKMERTTKEWINLAKEARDAGMLYLLLTGGEVFLRQDFKEIYEAISTMGFSTQIFTNATMITPNIAKWLGDIPPSKIGVTLYGASSETYEKICGDKDGLGRALKGVDLLLEHGISVQLRTTIIRDNFHDFNKILEFAQERKIELVVASYVSPRREGCGTQPENERLNPDQAAKLEIYVDEVWKKRNNQIVNLSQIDEYDNKKESEDRSNTLAQNDEDSFFCSAGKSSFWVTWDGRITPCGDMDSPYSLPFKTGFIAAWNELQKLCSIIPNCSECAICPDRQFCLSCPARLKIETGSYQKPSSYLCQNAKKRKELKTYL